MSALINRSLTNVRTELEFLRDSEVIDGPLMEAFMRALPTKYTKDMPPWGVEKLGGPVQGLTEKMAAHSIQERSLEKVAAPSEPPRAPASPSRPIGYCKALYNYDAQESSDLALTKGDQIAVMEHLSADWWKGFRKVDGPRNVGVFPSNYVAIISESEFEQPQRKEREKTPPAYEERAVEDYKAPQPVVVMPQMSPMPQPMPPQMPMQPMQPMQQPMQAQPSYGGYAQFPPPLTGYYPQPMQPVQQPVQQPEQLSGHDHLKSFGSKLGNAAIFGAGSAIGSDLVHSIF